MFRLTEAKLHEAKQEDLARLAKFCGIAAETIPYKGKLVEALVVKLGLAESWPPRHQERRW